MLPGTLAPSLSLDAVASLEAGDRGEDDELEEAGERGEDDERGEEGDDNSTPAWARMRSCFRLSCLAADGS